jgi:hypothetical protein
MESLLKQLARPTEGSSDAADNVSVGASVAKVSAAD